MTRIWVETSYAQVPFWTSDVLGLFIILLFLFLISFYITLQYYRCCRSITHFILPLNMLSFHTSHEFWLKVHGDFKLFFQIFFQQVYSFHYYIFFPFVIFDSPMTTPSTFSSVHI